MKKRLFVAIKLDEKTLRNLCLFQKELKQELPYRGIRWVDPDLFHLTLQFLGDTDSSQFSKLKLNLESCAKKVEPFELLFEGTGFFGSNTAVRAIWAGTQPSPALRKLFNEVTHSTAFLSLEKHPRFSPHLTLARIPNWMSREENFKVAETIRSKNPLVFGDIKVNSFELIESILNPFGPVYKTEQLFNLV